MNTLFLDCSMGAAGDMLAGALLELMKDPDEILSRIHNLQIPNVTIQTQASMKCGITGTHMEVSVFGQTEHVHDDNHHEYEHHHAHTHDHHYEHDHEHTHHHHHDHDHEHTHHTHGHAHPHEHHEHSSLQEIQHLIQGFALSSKVKEDILAVYQYIAQAESQVHAKPVEQVHFHEVGAMDALADITMVCMMMEELSPEQVIVSPICTGYGHVHCAHGILPVPAPATAKILSGMPVFAGEIESELCTPTGAALLHHFATQYGQMPHMTMERIGYGMGTKEFAIANCLRAVWGQTKDSADDVWELKANIDDMTAEEIADATKRLCEGAALDVYTMPISMKKSRPGTMLCVLCHEKDKEKTIRDIFCHTTTIGIRMNLCQRAVLQRREETVETPYGVVRRKICEGYGTYKTKFEYEDLARISRENGISMKELQDKI